MKAEITVSGIKIKAHIGVGESERSRLQLLEIDAGFTTDISTAARHDDIAESVDYMKVAETVTAAAAAREYKLVETLAWEIGKQLLKIKGIQSVRIKVVKYPEKLNGIAENISLELGPLDSSDM